MIEKKFATEGTATVTSYETLFVIHPEKGSRIKEFIEKFRKVVEGLDGTVTHIDEWGLRELAYRIDKQSKGFYTLLQYQSSARAVQELERNMKLTDGVLRYLTVRAADQAPTPEPAGVRNPSKEPPKVEGETTKSDPRS